MATTDTTRDRLELASLHPFVQRLFVQEPLEPGGKCFCETKADVFAFIGTVAVSSLLSMSAILLTDHGQTAETMKLCVEFQY